MRTELNSDAGTAAVAIDPRWSQLVQRVHDGDDSGMEELYKLFSTGVRFYLCRQLGPQDLDDKVHDIFLIITQSIQRGDLRDPDRLMGYVRTIVRRQVAAYIENAVQSRRNLTDLDFGMTLTDQHPNPERRLIAEQNTEVALGILNSLHKRDREVLIRFYLKEQSQDQICREMSLTETQFRLIKSRAKARFGELGKRRMAQRKRDSCDSRRLPYNGCMRIVFPLFLVCAACAQPPQPPPPQPAVPALVQANQLINDYANQRRYAGDNQKVATPMAGEERVVFMGDSITDGWGRGNNGSSFFPGKSYINRGISGQVTAQMLLRFYPDVIAHKPKAVVILAGTNDIGGNIGPVAQETIQNNLAAMADIAKANGIKVVLAAVMPVCDCTRNQTTARPPERINALNRWIKDFAAKSGHVYLDYFTPMADAQGMLKAQLTGDGLHPNAAGYEVMGPLAASAIAQALSR